MTTWLAIFIGGGTGSVLRYILAKHYNSNSVGQMMFPYGTFIANILSCLLLGWLIYKHHNGQLSDHIKFMLAVGFCGGLSTFSTFGYEIFTYMEKGQIMHGLGYTSISLILGLLAIGVGIKLAAL